MEKERNKGRRFGRSIYYLAALIFAIILVILVSIFLFSGDVSVNNNDGFSEKTQSLTCEKNNALYPFLAGIDDEGTIKINVVFDKKTLDTISLVYKIYYDDKAQIERSEVQSRILMNENFNNDNLGTEALGSVFSALKDAMQLSLQANSDEINSITAKYFLLDGLNGMYSRKVVMEHYINEGFDCRENN